MAPPAPRIVGAGTVVEIDPKTPWLADTIGLDASALEVTKLNYLSSKQKNVLMERTSCAAVALVQDSEGVVVSESPVCVPLFDDKGEIASFAEVEAVSSLGKTLADVVAKVPVGGTLVFCSTSEWWRKLYEKLLKDLAVQLATAKPTAKIIIITTRASDPDLITAAAQRAALGHHSNVTVIRLIPLTDGTYTSRYLVCGRQHNLSALSAAWAPSSFGNSSDAAMEQAESTHKLPPGFLARERSKALRGMAPNCLTVDLQHVTRAFADIITTYPQTLKIRSGDAKDGDMESFKAAMRAKHPTRWEEGEGVNYVVIHRDERATIQSLHEAQKEYAGPLPLGAAALQATRAAHIALRNGHLSPWAINTGESAAKCVALGEERVGQPVSRAHSHCTGDGNPLPGLEAELRNKVAPGSVTEDKCVFVAFTHATTLAGIAKRLLYEALLSLLLGTQVGAADEVYPPVAGARMAVTGLNFISCGAQTGDPLRAASALLGGPAGKMLLSELVLLGATAMPAGFLVDRLMLHLGLTRAQALAYTVEDAYSAYSKVNGLRGAATVTVMLGLLGELDITMPSTVAGLLERARAADAKLRGVSTSDARGALRSIILRINDLKLRTLLGDLDTTVRTTVSELLQRARNKDHGLHGLSDAQTRAGLAVIVALIDNNVVDATLRGLLRALDTTKRTTVGELYARLQGQQGGLTVAEVTGGLARIAAWHNINVDKTLRSVAILAEQTARLAKEAKNMEGFKFR